MCSVGKESTCQCRRLGSIPGEGDGHPLQYSRLEHSMDRRVWWATFLRVARVGHNLATKAPPYWFCLQHPVPQQTGSSHKIVNKACLLDITPASLSRGNQSWPPLVSAALPRFCDFIIYLSVISLGQFSSVAWLCPILCHPMDCSTLGLLVHCQLPEFTQTHVH